MSEFTIYPAIDLKEGQVVRLTQGDWNQEQSFSITPSDAAKKWISQGADWLHVVNLDGAFGKDSQPNLEALQSILEVGKGKVLIQFGGGLRSLETIRAIIGMGVSRVILGTAAVENSSLLYAALNTFGSDKIVLGIDAKDGYVRIAGWKKSTRVTPIEIATPYIDRGLRTIIFTNIRRDGMQQGVDVQSTKRLADTLQRAVIASGGVGSLEDIKKVKRAGLPGVVVGKALYKEKFTLWEAVQC
jgi:phosphoribosylformimino-5-aminoimidazole carboxamide ribotide isomerase